MSILILRVRIVIKITLEQGILKISYITVRHDLQTACLPQSELQKLCRALGPANRRERAGAPSLPPGMRPQRPQAAFRERPAREWLR